MKRFLLIASCCFLLAAFCSSCAGMKRDCQGRKHTRLANGIYI